MTKLCAAESSLAVVPRQRVMKAWAGAREEESVGMVALRWLQSP